MLNRIVALLLVITTALGIPAQANAGILRNGAAAAGIVVGGARLAKVISKITPLAMFALRAEMSGGGRQLTAGLQSALDEHRVLGPKVLIETLARSVAHDFSLHGRAIEIAEQVGLNIESLFREEEREIAKAIKKGEAETHSGADPCHDRAGKDGPYKPREIERELAEKYGAENVKPRTLPSTSKPNVKASLKGLVVNGVPFDVRGFPIFDKLVKVDLNFTMQQAAFKAAGYRGQMAMATRRLRDMLDKNQISSSMFNGSQMADIRKGLGQIDGYTWHHHQDANRMQLVPREIHRSVKHVGGKSQSGTCE